MLATPGLALDGHRGPPAVAAPPEDGTTRQWTLPERLGSLPLCASGRLLLGLAKRLAFADPDAATDELLPVTTITPLEPDFAHA